MALPEVECIKFITLLSFEVIKPICPTSILFVLLKSGFVNKTISPFFAFLMATVLPRIGKLNGGAKNFYFKIYKDISYKALAI